MISQYFIGMATFTDCSEPFAAHGEGRRSERTRWWHTAPIFRHQCTLVDPIAPGETRPSSPIFSPGTSGLLLLFSEIDGLDKGVSSVSDAQAMSKNDISRTRTPVSAASLITEPNLCAGRLRCKEATTANSSFDHFQFHHRMNFPHSIVFRVPLARVRCRKTLCL